MILDSHIHIWTEDYDKNKFYADMKTTGVDGGVVLSIPPTGYMTTKLTQKEKLDIVHDVTDGKDYLFPFYFIDPLEEDALEQVDVALSSGVYGFKIICYNFFPNDPRAVKVYEKIAAAGKPILFHTGILYCLHTSGEYNRPVNWEPLENVKDIRFSMAHVSWPWTDECIAVYGKTKNRRRYIYLNEIKNDYEVFIDLTPGTPPIYRRDVLSKLCNLFHDTLPQHILFGTDCSVNKYKIEYTQEMIARDKGIYIENEMSQEFIDNVFCNNLLRFIRQDHLIK